MSKPTTGGMVLVMAMGVVAHARDFEDMPLDFFVEGSAPVSGPWMALLWVRQVALTEGP